MKVQWLNECGHRMVAAYARSESTIRFFDHGCQVGGKLRVTDPEAHLDEDTIKRVVNRYYGAKIFDRLEEDFERSLPWDVKPD